MRRLQLTTLLTLVTVSFSPLELVAENWPQFRGPQAAGRGNGDPPVHFSADPPQNIAWKVPIAGLAHASPVVWDDRVFVTTARTDGDEEIQLKTGWVGGSGEEAEEPENWYWDVICLSLEDGRTLWSQTAHQGTPRQKRHIKASHANCSPATNGEYVVAMFGSEGLYCYTVDGELAWKVDLGELHSGPYNAPELEWGFSSSPVIYEDMVIVQVDCLNTNFVAVIDLATGKEIRRIERDDVATWSTPGVFKTEQNTQIVCNGYHEMAGYDLATGERLWHLGGGGDVPVPTPLSAGGRFILTNAHGGSPIYAIAHDARGDLTPEDDEEDEDEDEDASDGEAEEKQDGDRRRPDDPQPSSVPSGLIWWHPRGGSYMTTPIIYEDRVFVCEDRGRMGVGDLKTGERLARKRIGAGEANFSASPVIAAGRIYWVNEAGVVFVIETDGDYDVLAENDLGETCMATPALAGNALLVRSRSHLFKIATE